MPRYEIVAHVALELDGDTPEAAAETFRRDLLAGAGGRVAVSGLAVWRPGVGPAPGPVSSSLRRQLADFFAGVARSAAGAEATFRAEVEALLAGGVLPDGPLPRPGPGDEGSAGPGGGDAERWEAEGGAITRDRDDARRHGWTPRA